MWKNHVIRRLDHLIGHSKNTWLLFYREHLLGEMMERAKQGVTQSNGFRNRLGGRMDLVGEKIDFQVFLFF